MSCRHPVYQWTSIVTTHFPHLSEPQATVLALWSVGMVLARSCALSAVSTFLAAWLDATPIPCASSCASSVTKLVPNAARTAKQVTEPEPSFPKAA